MKIRWWCLSVPLSLLQRDRIEHLSRESMDLRTTTPHACSLCLPPRVASSQAALLAAGRPYPVVAQCPCFPAVRGPAVVPTPLVALAVVRVAVPSRPLVFHFFAGYIVVGLACLTFAMPAQLRYQM